jgi:nitroimidazol reductase NimA-like FMN-containing flavoprotein (pyridoxamine 5'-phosphate oxidase superfamily)
MRKRGLTADELRGFLSRPLICRIASLDEDGSPYVVPCWFLFEDDAFLVFASEGSRWEANLRRDPRVALTVDEYVGLDLSATSVVVQGQARVLGGPGWTGDAETDIRMRDAYVRVGVKYGAGEEEMRTGLEGSGHMDHAWIRIEPHRLISSLEVHDEG